MDLLSPCPTDSGSANRPEAFQSLEAYFVDLKMRTHSNFFSKKSSDLLWTRLCELYSLIFIWMTNHSFRPIVQKILMATFGVGLYLIFSVTILQIHKKKDSVRNFVNICQSNLLKTAMLYSVRASKFCDPFFCSSSSTMSLCTRCWASIWFTSSSTSSPGSKTTISSLGVLGAPDAAAEQLQTWQYGKWVGVRKRRNDPPTLNSFCNWIELSCHCLNLE